MLLDDEGKLAAWNVGAERIFGYTVAEIMGQDFSRLFLPEDVASDIPRRELEQARTAAGNSGGTDDILLLRRDGTRFWASGVTTALRDDGGTLRGFCKVVRDITDKKLNEQSLHEEDRRKDEFLATLAHELRNPLAPLANALEVLHRSNRDPVAIDRNLKVMARQVEKLKRLIADILDVSRISNRRIELRRKTVDLRSIIEHALESEQHTITAARHDLSLSLPSEPVWMDGDAIRLEQIFANLLHNAANYTDPGGRIALTLELDDHQNGPAPKQAIFRIRDTGVGIPREQLSKIFELFARVDTSYARPIEGLGIGLSLVKSLVELHGGTVQADSEGIGKGSVFSVRLPLGSEAMASNENGGEQPRAAARQTPNPSARCILVVDDNMDAADSLSYLLRSFGHDVQVALNGPDALDATAAFRPDIVFLDIGMPGMDGYEVARRLRRHPGLENTLLVALSGYGSDKDRRHSFEVGFDVHLVKPVDADTLTSILDTIENGR
jgi:PAS domain S-box-containing protein